MDYFSFTAFTKTLAGLKAGMLCAGMVIVCFLVMLRAAFSARCLMMKLLHHLGEFLDNTLNLNFLNAGRFGDLIDDFCLCHS